MNFNFVETVLITRIHSPKQFITLLLELLYELKLKYHNVTNQQSVLVQTVLFVPLQNANEVQL